ncbi:MAG: dihydrofolate reductase family protein [Candidatus Moduliflexus flocculans]|nr:dihydrofolate reductase family protein [Candidatus Moduliflexus flocculans]
MKQDLVDEISVYVAPMIFGGASAPTFASGPGLERDAAVHLKNYRTLIRTMMVESHYGMSVLKNS